VQRRWRGFQGIYHYRDVRIDAKEAGGGKRMILQMLMKQMLLLLQVV
jgi:hypothetical protein